MTGQQLSYVSAVRAAVADRLAAPASVFEGCVRTWGDTLDRAARIAGGLLALGVEEGDRVGILSANSDDYLALYLAVPWAGAVLVPLNCRWSEAENRFAIEDCRPRAIFVSDDFADANAAMLAEEKVEALISLGSPRGGWHTLAELLAREPIDAAFRGGDDLFAIFYTGGTTGRSKGVMLSHDGFVANCQSMRELGLFPQGCRGLVVPPLFHLAAAAVLTMTMLAGGTAVIGKGFEPAATLDLINQAGVTDALLIPTMIQMMLDAPGFDAAKLKQVKSILYGASPMQEATLDRIMAAAPHVDFVQLYGMTEVSCSATMLGADYHKGEHRAAGRHRGAGKPISIAEIGIADDAGNLLPTGEVGEILIRGRGVMLGYWNQPELTAEALRGGWMYTGDGGRLDDHGILYVVDRIKDMIVSGGENVFSAEVESVLALHPAVAQVAVIGVPDARWGERVHAVILPRAGAALSENEVVAHCRERIADYKCPRSVEFRNEPLPLSAAGKVLKAELRKTYWEGQSRNVA
ncbi:AMP-binding protein [Novosphingobium aquae]|uniref:AMP-binding protein n=1 Tax=Novosphingobium aquae TaxID=3133435 RepID=A0ABU8SB10_9SPHN